MEQLSDVIGLDLIMHGTVSDEATIRDTAIAQPLIVAASIATANLLELFDVSAVAGHSVGEVAAGYVSGILSEADAMKLVQVRANAMAKAAKSTTIVKIERISVNKKTSQGRGNIKMSSMPKKKKADFKKYRGQGR